MEKRLEKGGIGGGEEVDEDEAEEDDEGEENTRAGSGCGGAFC